MNPLISIIIPTKNRSEYAIPLIESILNLNENELEIVVQDNSTDQTLHDHVNANWKEKIRYFHEPKELSIIENFNLSIENSKGEYICIIGDDDGISPFLLENVKKAKRENIDAICWKLNFTYRWPSKSDSGHMYFFPLEEEDKIYDVKNELSEFLKNGGIHYLNYKLPKIYHGVIKREKLELVKSQTSNYFNGLSADIYSSVALSCVIPKVWSVRLPLTISGSSPASDQTHETKEAKQLKLEDAPHLKGRKNYIWNSLIPKVYSVETIWAESSVQALQLMGRQQEIKKLNLNRMLAEIIIANPQHKETIISEHLPQISKDVQINAKLKLTLIKIILEKYSFKIIRKIKKLLLNQKVEQIKNLPTIKDAYELVKQRHQIEI
jgi:glycosyltransferase involved in cell wall biosynthesis